MLIGINKSVVSSFIMRHPGTFIIVPRIRGPVKVMVAVILAKKSAYRRNEILRTSVMFEF